jgi:hypothetical protein
MPVRLILCAAALVAGVVAMSAQSRPLTADDLFDDTRVHDVWIRISDADLQQLLEQFEGNTYYKAALEWRGLNVADIGIRSRGGATRSNQKPGLQVDFNRYRPDQEFLGLQQVVLDNVWHDESTMRERLSMLLFRKMGVPVPREAHARLYLGEARELRGVYVIVEDIDERFVKRHFGEDDGYLFEYERVDGYHFENLDDLAEYARRFEAQTHEKEDPEVVFGPIRDMVRVINNSAPDALPAAIAPYLDLERFLTFVAVTNYLAVWDSFIGEIGMANFSLYRYRNSTRFEFIPWDQDNAFASPDWTPWWSVQKNVLLRKLWMHAPTRERYLQKLLEVAAAADGWLEPEVEREYRQVRPAVLADPKKYRTNAQFESTVGELRRFARERSRRVRELVAQAKATPNLEELPNWNPRGK